MLHLSASESKAPEVGCCTLTDLAKPSAACILAIELLSLVSVLALEQLLCCWYVIDSVRMGGRYSSFF